MSLTIPVGWISVDLAEILEPRSSRVSPSDFLEAPYIGLEHVEAHTNKLLCTVPAGTMSSSAVRFYANDVLYGRMRPYLNKVVCPSFDGLASAEFIVFPDTWAINQRFLLWRLTANDFVEFACGQYEGDRPRVKFDQLAKFRLNLPPVAEQTRIIEKIEELFSDLDDGIAELKAAQKKLVLYRQSLLKAAVEGSLTAEWREAQRQRSGEPKETGTQLLERILTERRARWEAKQIQKFKNQGKEPPTGWKLKYSEQKKSVGLYSRDIPDTWIWATVEQLGQVQLGRQRSPSKMKGECPANYIRAANITENGIDFSDVLEMDFTDIERETFHLQCGDILLTEASGSAEHVGRPAIWPAVDGLYCFQNTVIRFRPLGVTSIFAYYTFLSFQKLGIFQQLSGGVGINHLSAGKFSALAVPLPPIAEQEAIVEVLESVFAVLDKQSAAISHLLKQAAAQRQNILKAAFAGQLVPQDPNDEPAEVLVERIRAERAAADGVAGKRASGRSRVRRVSGVRSSRERP